MIKLGRIMMIIGVIIYFLACLTACEKDTPPTPSGFELVKYSAKDVVKSNSTKTYAHYMPWYETPETNNGNWGLHWTMSNQNPNTVDANGRRQIASHFYPLTGPYASSDPNLIEYHLLLMKYSGIDGVLIDWYGSSDYNDYGGNRENSEALIAALENVGLEYAIVYEDRTVPEVVKKDGSFDRIEAAQNDMLYIENEYFDDANYILVNGAPLLMVFGPEEFHKPDEWSEIFSIFTTQPSFVTLNYTSSQTGSNSVGEYIWVDQGSLDNKYATKNKFEVFIGGAYPGFKDFYGPGGWGSSFAWSIDHKQGETFKQNLQKAKTAGVDYVQLITWNDYGEGTMIEPTEEFQFALLEHVQDFTGVSYTKLELEEIFKLYNLRKSTASSDQKYLDQAFYYLVSLQAEKAVHLIDSLGNNQ